MPTQTEHMLDNVVAMRVNEETTEQEMAQMTEAVRRAVMEWGKIRLLVAVEGFRHMEPDALLGKMSFLTRHAREIERTALVCRRVWIKAWVQAGGLGVPNEVSVFDESEERDAWQWIRQ